MKAEKSIDVVDLYMKKPLDVSFEYRYLLFSNFLPFDIYYQFDLNTYTYIFLFLDWINLGLRPSRLHGKC